MINFVVESNESDADQERYESLEELSRKEMRELFEKIWFGTDCGDEWRLNPPWGGLNPSMSSIEWLWPGPGSPGLTWPGPISPGPTWPWPDFPDSPIGQRSALGLQSTREPTASIRLTARSDLREEDSEETHVDVDITTKGYGDPDQIRIAGAGWKRIIETGAGIAKEIIGGGGNGGGINVGGVTVEDCTIVFENVTIQENKSNRSVIDCDVPPPHIQNASRD